MAAEFYEFPTNIQSKPNMTFYAKPYRPVDITNNKEGKVQNTVGDAIGIATLYIPASYADAIGSSWGSESLSFNAQAASQVVNSAAGGNLTGAAGIALTAMTHSAVAALARAPGGKQIATAFAYNSGQALVPNQVLTLESANHYELSLNWELNPNNQTEAIAVRKMCEFFKRSSTPTVGNIGFIATLVYPPIFDIVVTTADPSADFSKPARLKGDTDGVRIYKNMVLTSYSAAYGGSATTAMFYPDGESISTQLQLQFKSLRPGYAEQGFNTGGDDE